MINKKTTTKNKMLSYSDKYFERMNQILEAEGKNPWVNMQVFARKGKKIHGVEKAINTLLNNSNLDAEGGRIYAKNEGDNYESKETIMNIVAPIQEIGTLETLYLGILSEDTSQANGFNVNFERIFENMGQVKNLAGDRNVLYFGARHFAPEMDEKLARLAHEAGFDGVATEHGAKPFGWKAKGTIPHASENIYAFYHNRDNAVVEATKAFDNIIGKEVPRVALIDYNNKEITDSVATAKALNGNLAGVRIDTCGENLAEGAFVNEEEFRKYFGNVAIPEEDKKYWFGNGVTITGAYALRKSLDNAGFENVGIFLSSGFSNPEKVLAFNRAEEILNRKLYVGIGAGFADNRATFTADIIAVGNTLEEVDFYDVNNKVRRSNIIHKVGRNPKLNPNLERRV